MDTCCRSQFFFSLKKKILIKEGQSNIISSTHRKQMVKDTYGVQSQLCTTMKIKRKPREAARGYRSRLSVCIIPQNYRESPHLIRRTTAHNTNFPVFPLPDGTDEIPILIFFFGCSIHEKCATTNSTSLQTRKIKRGGDK